MLYRISVHKFRRLAQPSFTRAFTMMAEPRRFAPLGANAQDASKDLPRLKGIVFDVDGTLCLPQNYMFGEMRRVLGIDKATDILDHCYSLPASQEEVALEKIRNIEREAMIKQEPQPGLSELINFLESQKIPRAICTRNFEAPVSHLLNKFLPGKSFNPVITRDFKPPKPSPAGILHIAKSWGFVRESDGIKEGDASQMLMIGDSIDDMTAGFAAKAATVLLVNETNAYLAHHEHTDLVISRLDELIEVLKRGFVGRIGREERASDTSARAENVLRHGRAEGDTLERREE